jgi:predicted transcriptional regulator
MTNEDFRKLGFKESTVLGTKAMSFQLKSILEMVVENVGTNKEIVWLLDTNYSCALVTNMVCIHDFTFDGHLTEKKVSALVELLKTGRA